MMIKNIILAIIVISLLGSIGYYLYKSKKKGKGCMSCPYSKNCSKSCK